jgi:hypothetical protein
MRVKDGSHKKIANGEQLAVTRGGAVDSRLFLCEIAPMEFASTPRGAMLQFRIRSF